MTVRDIGKEIEREKHIEIHRQWMIAAVRDRQRMI